MYIYISRYIMEENDLKISFQKKQKSQDVWKEIQNSREGSKK